MLDCHAPGHPLHLIERGHCRGPCFFCENDLDRYLALLDQCSKRSGCAVHAYVLMGNHVHLLVTPSRAGGASRLARSLRERYARHVLEEHKREAALWEDRVELRPVHPRRYLLECMRYIELNPVRAGLVARASEYGWSSHRANALGEPSEFLTPHAFYCALGRSSEERQAAYRAMFPP
jgi:putative transposase